MHTDFEIVKYSYLFNKEVLLSDKDVVPTQVGAIPIFWKGKFLVMFIRHMNCFEFTACCKVRM